MQKKKPPKGTDKYGCEKKVRPSGKVVPLTGEVEVITKRFVTSR
jgi:hypothetical protein